MEIRESSKKIKLEIMGAPVLRNPNFIKEFIIYSYEIKKSIATILIQKEDNNEDCPIAIFSKTLHNHDKRYSFIENQMYTIMKVLNNMKYFVSQNKFFMLTLHLNVRNYILEGE